MSLSFYLSVLDDEFISLERLQTYLRSVSPAKDLVSSSRGHGTPKPVPGSTHSINQSLSHYHGKCHTHRLTTAKLLQSQTEQPPQSQRSSCSKPQSLSHSPAVGLMQSSSQMKPIHHHPKNKSSTLHSREASTMVDPLSVTVMPIGANVGWLLDDGRFALSNSPSPQPPQMSTHTPPGWVLNF